MNPDLHKAQIHILDSLRRVEQQSFSQLMKPLAMQSDAFKFHIRKLRTLGLISKLPDSGYELTAKGKEFSNKLNRPAKKARMQPKLSILIIARRRNSAGDTEYLCQERQRQPFYGFWGAGISGPILWGESHKEASARELLKQAGMQAARFSEVLFYRQRDYSAQTQLLLEDKLFILVEATNYTIVKKDTWAGGSNAWLTLPELEKKPKHFSTLRNALHAQEAGESFVSHATLYEADEY